MIDADFEQATTPVAHDQEERQAPSTANGPLSTEERQALAAHRKRFGSATRLGAAIGIAGTTLMRLEQGCDAYFSTRQVVSAWLASQDRPETTG